MANEHLRALLARRAPGVPVTSLEKAARVHEGWLQNYLRPGTRSLPTAERLMKIAEVIGGGCTPGEVHRALLRDLYPGLLVVGEDGRMSDESVDLSDDERKLLAAYWRIPVADRERAVEFLELRPDERAVLAAYRGVPEVDRPRVAGMIELFSRGK